MIYETPLAEKFIREVLPTAYDLQEATTATKSTWVVKDNICTSWAVEEALKDAGCEYVHVEYHGLSGARNRVVMAWFTLPPHWKAAPPASPPDAGQEARK